MIYRLAVPAAEPEVAEIRILEWHGEPGHTFESGDLIVELESHKALVEIRAAQRGVLRAVHAPAGEWCPIGSTIALFADDPGESLPAGEAGADLHVDFAVT